jgi:murein DD-endopeptidase MepM/ murein hydrolase activator NlpD
MSRVAELSTAAVIAVSGIAAMIWWPDPNEPWPPVLEITEAPEAAAPAVATQTTIPSDAVTVQPTGPQPEPDALLSSDLFSFPDVRDASGTDAGFEAPGALVDGSGTGIWNTTNFAPDMRFPVETAQAYANSQAWSAGGFYGPDGEQCAPESYAYPWRDTFCEDGGPDAPICPAGGSHMGQDLRPPTCQGGTYWAVAATDGVVTSIGAYSVRLMSEDGLRFTYLHLDPASVTVETGDTVSRGQRLGRISNAYGGTPATVHLHFEIRAAFVAGDAGLIAVPVPPYATLVDAYARLAAGEDGGEGA